ncbi:MAG: FkbM family methyltransferase [Chlamydiota bacterium]|nr:FkbM family methyltransferase [Chlamydiota bacterium]
MKNAIKKTTTFFSQLAFISIGFILFSCEKNTNEPNHENKVTIYESKTNQLSGDEQEVNLLQHFPHHLYDRFEIPEIGSFDIDSRVDIIKNVIRSQNTWEPEIVELLHKYARVDSVAIDCGAHIGTHSVLLSKLVGENGKVIVFEPQSKLFQELINNLKINNLQNVSAYKCAVGRCNDTVTLEKPVIDNEGGTKLGIGGEKIQMIPIDSLHLNNVSLIKIDVENHEYDVLLGAKETILNSKPVIILEILGNVYTPIENRTEQAQKIFDLLTEMGYEYSFIPESWSDWIAIHKSMR